MRRTIDRMHEIQKRKKNIKSLKHCWIPDELQQIKLIKALNAK